MVRIKVLCPTQIYLMRTWIWTHQTSYRTISQHADLCHPAHTVDILQCNVNVLCTRIPELGIVQRRYAPAAVYKKHISVLLIPPSCEALSVTGMTIWLVTKWMVTLLSLVKTVHCCIVLLLTTIKAVAEQLFTAGFTFTICSVYIPLLSIVTLVDFKEFSFSFVLPFFCWETYVHGITSGTL
jgi:hypothetical protein